MAANAPRRKERLKSEFRVSLDADEVEHACLSGVRASSELSLLNDRIGGTTNDQSAGTMVDRFERDARVSDSMAGKVTDELHRRSRMPGKGYPFRFDGKALEYIGSKTLVYEFCLAVSRAETLTEEDYVRLPRNFERISAISARLYLGPGAHAIRIGWPTDGDDPRDHPNDFAGRAELLKSTSPKESDEWDFRPSADFHKAADNAKDHGMDFIAWKPFADERLGRLTLLGQCACGRSDQDNDAKAKDLNLHAVKNLFSRLTWLEPVKVFTTPYHINAADRFKSFHSLQNLVFDRARLSDVCERVPLDSDLIAIKSRLRKLIQSVTGKIKPNLTGGGKRRVG